MNNYTGNPKFPIWLIGDSPPEAWADKLDTPLDPRHPVRHNIWTSVVDPMQDWLYRQKKLRLDTSQIYIRNVKNQKSEPAEQSEKVLKALLNKYKPRIVLTFGVAAFRLTLLASGEVPTVFAKSTSLLGVEFRNRLEIFQENKINVIPLLHRSITTKFLVSHDYFVSSYGNNPPNYFDYVGKALAELLIEKLYSEPIWIK